jgi:thiaminase/transcriptional activator TenA
MQDLWAAATRHRFLDGVRDGSLPVAALDTWLAQDALFVADLLGLQARLLARAPRSDQVLLAGGAVALVGELEWFEHLAAARGLDLAAAPLPATLAYRHLLQRLDAASYADALGCLQVVERVYLEAWRSALPGAPAYAELVAHWTTPGFAAYVDGLSAASARAGAPYAGLVEEVLRHEVMFWDMAVPRGAVPRR